MSVDQTFEALKSFLENKPAAVNALKHLKAKAEIGLIIDNQLHCAVRQESGRPVVERRPAQNPDVEFYIKPESISVMTNSPGQDVGELGILVLKEIIAKNISIKVPGTFFNILKNGYIDIIRQGGAQFLGFLAQHGLTNFTKITSLIKKLKKSS